MKGIEVRSMERGHLELDTLVVVGLDEDAVRVDPVNSEVTEEEGKLVVDELFDIVSSIVVDFLVVVMVVHKME